MQQCLQRRHLAICGDGFALLSSLWRGGRTSPPSSSPPVGSQGPVARCCWQRPRTPCLWGRSLPPSWSLWHHGTHGRTFSSLPLSRDRPCHHSRYGIRRSGASFGPWQGLLWPSPATSASGIPLRHLFPLPVSWHYTIRATWRHHAWRPLSVGILSFAFVCLNIKDLDTLTRNFMFSFNLWYIFVKRVQITLMKFMSSTSFHCISFCPFPFSIQDNNVISLQSCNSIFMLSAYIVVFCGVSHPDWHHGTLGIPRSSKWAVTICSFSPYLCIEKWWVRLALDRFHYSWLAWHTLRKECTQTMGVLSILDGFTHPFSLSLQWKKMSALSFSAKLRRKGFLCSKKKSSNLEKRRFI